MRNSADSISQQHGQASWSANHSIPLGSMIVFPHAKEISGYLCWGQEEQIYSMTDDTGGINWWTTTGCQQSSLHDIRNGPS